MLYFVIVAKSKKFVNPVTFQLNITPTDKCSKEGTYLLHFTFCLVKSLCDFITTNSIILHQVVLDMMISDAVPPSWYVGFLNFFLSVVMSRKLLVEISQNSLPEHTSRSVSVLGSIIQSGCISL